MPVQEFECQIARGQIGRYLNGEGLSSEGLRQLGAHVADCAECKSFLDQRKAALQGMLGEAVVVAHEPIKPVVEKSPSEALIAQIRARSEVAPQEAPAPAAEPVATAKAVKPILTKPILLCGALGVVLVGMTYINRNPSGLLGPRASQLVAADTTAKPSASDTVKSATTTSQTPSSTTEKAAPPKSTTQAKAPATTTKPAAANQTGSNVATDVPAPTKPATPPAVTIDPTSKPKSPITLSNPKTEANSAEQAEATGADSSKPSQKPVRGVPTAAVSIKPKAHTTKRSWRRAAGHRRWNLRHLRPGTGAIHVYR